MRPVSSVRENVVFYVRTVFDRLMTTEFWLLSASVAFNFLITLIPLLLLVLTALGIYLNATDAAYRLSEYLNTILPFSIEYKEQFINEMLVKTRELTSNTLITGVIGMVGLFWTVSGLFDAMESVLDRIFQRKIAVAFWRSKLKDMGMILISFVLFSLSVVLTSLFQVFQLYFHNIFSAVPFVEFLQKAVAVLFSFLLSWILFCGLYRFLPTHKLSSKTTLFASFCAAVLFELLKYLFTLYVFYFADFTIIYGTYATFVILLLWIYYTAAVFGVGAVFGYAYQQRHQLSHSVATIKKKNPGNKKAV